MNKYSLSHKEFEELRPHMSKRLAPENVEAAYAVMVNDEPVQVVAARIDKSRQHVHSVVRSIWTLHETNSKPLPTSWVRVVATLPADLAKTVRQMERDALRLLGTKKDSS